MADKTDLTREEIEELRPTVKNLEFITDTLEYDNIEHFLSDNEGAVEAVLEWIARNARLFGIKAFEDGDEVILCANEKEGWEEERATVVAYEGRGIYLVEVEHGKFPDYNPEDPDGLREVTVDQMRRPEVQ